MHNKLLTLACRTPQPHADTKLTANITTDNIIKI